MPPTLQDACYTGDYLVKAAIDHIIAVRSIAYCYCTVRASEQLIYNRVKECDSN